MSDAPAGEEPIRIEVEGIALEFPYARAVLIAQSLNAAVARRVRAKREAEGLDLPPKDCGS